MTYSPQPARTLQQAPLDARKTISASIGPVAPPKPSANALVDLRRRRDRRLQSQRRSDTAARNSNVYQPDNRYYQVEIYR
jgi:hypothetical protein